MKLVGTVMFALVLMAVPVAAETQRAPAQEVSADEAKTWLALFDKIVDAVVTHRNDCSTMAGDLNAIINVNQNAIRIAREAKEKGKQLPVSAHQHMLDGTRRMVAALDKCGRDEKVGAAFGRIDLGRRK
jgi:hypothetical protein